MISAFFRPFPELCASAWRRYSRVVVFAIIPLFFLVNAAVIHFNIGKFFMGNVDPEYFFLYNGVIMGAGNLSVQYTSNPGTPLMVLIAISSRAVSLFQPGDYLADVVNDPEKYIHAANLLMVFLMALLLFICGYYIKKVTGSWIAGLLFQVGLPFTTSLLFLSGLLKAEAVSILPALLMCFAVFYYFGVHDRQQPVTNRTLLIFGVVSGLGIACKLILLPVMLIPLILLKASFWQKARYILYSILSFSVFAYPVVFNNGKFWSWVSGIMTHTGKYGEGAEGIVNFSAVPGNLAKIYNNDRYFIYITGIAFVLGILMSIRVLGRRLAPRAAFTVRALLAVSVAILAGIALDMKHFEVHYFFPFYVFKYLMVSLIFLFLVNLDLFRRSKFTKVLAILIVCIPVVYISYKETLKIKSYNNYAMEKKASRDAEYATVMSLVEPGSPVIISGRYYGAPFVEFGHYEGLKMTGILMRSFIPYLKQRFPVSFQYISWADKFYYWGNFVDFQYILERTSRSLYIFIGEKNDMDLPVIEERAWQVLDKDSVSRELIYENSQNGDKLIRITPRPDNTGSSS